MKLDFVVQPLSSNTFGPLLRSYENVEDRQARAWQGDCHALHLADSVDQTAIVQAPAAPAMRGLSWRGPSPDMSAAIPVRASWLSSQAPEGRP